MSSRPDHTLPSPGQRSRFPSAPPRPRLPARTDVVVEVASELVERSDETCHQAELTDVLMPGARAGEYIIGELIGHGGFGQVYEAVHPIIGKRAAVKVLSREFCENPEQARRFVNEARAVNTVRHKNIVDVFSFGRLDDGRLYFLMEMLEGETLQGYLERRSQLQIDEALHIFTSIAAALEATHAAGIVHRDLKPSNVFLAVDASGDITPKILDFGVAKIQLHPGALDITGEGKILGTPTYMAPEQSLGSKVSSAADVYSFGVMLHRALAGRLPFQSQHALGMAVAHATQPPPAMSSVDPRLPRALDDIVLRMLSKDPAQRPGGPMQALAEIERIARVEGLLPADARFVPSLPALPPSDLPSTVVVRAPDSVDVSVSSFSTAPTRRGRAVSSRARSLRRRALARERTLATPGMQASARNWARLGMAFACFVVAFYLTWSHFTQS